MDRCTNAGPGAPPLIGLTVECLEPLALKLWRRAEEPLTGREIEVCQLLTARRPRAEIVERLRASENVAITHCRNLYEKPGVHSRSDLIQSLNARLEPGRHVWRKAVRLLSFVDAFQARDGDDGRGKRAGGRRGDGGCRATK